MSMLTAQVDELRETAVYLRAYSTFVGHDGLVNRNYALFDAARLMDDAADVIENLRDRLTDTETCRFNVVIDQDPTPRRRGNICECDACGYRCAYGFIVDERFRYCPNCGRKVVV